MIDILDLANSHESWRRQCLNLIPSENVTSYAVRSLLTSDLGHRYTSPDRFYMGTRFLDEIERNAQELAKKVFDAESADVRPLSGHVTDLIYLACFTKPNDIVLCLSADHGGYPGIGKQALLSTRLQLKNADFPFSKTAMNIQTQAASELILRTRPAVVVFGASLFLFPHPVQELSKVAREIGAEVGYDGSHVLGLIAGKSFQDPLRQGATVLFGSTHKSFFGPQGGIILADREHGEIINSQIHPGLVDNAHWNRIAALSLALEETLKFGKAYAKQVVANAKILAKALHDAGFPVACSELGYTESHQVFLDFGGHKQGGRVARKLEKANIIVDSAVRIGVCEATRRGMKKAEMHKIAEFMERAAIKNENVKRVKTEVEEFMEDYQQVEFCFEPS